MSTSTTCDMAILGAGAAGLFCAAQAAARGRRVVLLESGERAGRKILISGGGRCNFTNLHTSHANFISNNPHFAKSALARYAPQRFIALIERYGIAYHEKTLGQLFCDGSAQAIVSMLEAECRVAGVETRLRTPVERVEQTGNSFRIITPAGTVEAGVVIVATGGLSIPKLGATGIGYDIARSFGLPIIPPRPALVPFTFSANDSARWSDLSGLSAEVIATNQPTPRKSFIPTNGRATPKAGNTQRSCFREKLLITHRGLSGPAALQASSYWQQGEAVHIDLAPGHSVFTPLLAPGARKDEAATTTLLREHLPSRLADRWLMENAPPDWKNTSLEQLEERLHDWTVIPAGTEGFAKAEVTAGGVDTAVLDSTTMQAKSVPGLAFVGEVVDVTGWLGGFNFQWAWASAYAAAAAAL